MSETTKVWLITGASRGLGRAFTEAALAAGDRVVATAREPARLEELVARHPGRCVALPLDVVDRSAVHAGIERGIAAFGQLDVVVNNAGYGLVGAIEELTEADVRAQLETNLFGALWVTQAVLPHLRARGSGHIVQISSVGGVGSMATFGAYNASKWALEGFSEALAMEVAPFGIRVTIVEPGSFATDWSWGSMRFAAPLPAYDGLRESLFGVRRFPWDMSQQAQDAGASPAIGARELVEHVHRDKGPLRLLLGEDSPAQVRAVLDGRRDDYLRNTRFKESDSR
ncbi:SDR family NAD(P)-dependent oxidoreductase [Myxococcus qinghaiensis]|uniref:SDR family NAD(P)-dependent oxidoreductase n=1 Tax=Myxococcus qinghaiensis TaxID=2906758 RepID=UPI0020A81DFF|nr:SDR family NAD(P)-dependent oxidoreductase [Myxococcus qinghaiensis]MCP3168158.1 SDR family NAD(P)-dependent oxidoreductase [Myxococcus qinghaiensis]